MPRYRFTGFVETVLHGLSHGVNAELHRGKHGQPEGSTVVVVPGDEVTTSKPYPHAFLEDVGRAPAKKRAPRKKAAAKPKTTDPAPATPADDEGKVSR